MEAGRPRWDKLGPMDLVDALFNWLLEGAPGATSSEQVVSRLCQDLNAAAVPVDRFAAFVRTLHPQILGRSFIWSPGQPVQVEGLTLEMQRTAFASHGPAAEVMRSGAELRRCFAAG